MAHEASLATIRKQIELGEKSVQRQRRIVQELKRKGHAAMVAEELLFALESNLRAHRATYSFLMRREAMLQYPAAMTPASQGDEKGRGA